MSRTKLNHFRVSKTLPNKTTLNTAVVRILSWLVTWNVAASKLPAAMYCTLFCKVYNIAGIAIFQLSPENTAPASS